MLHKNRRVLILARTLHVYLTMLAFVMMVFFAITGIVLNHEDWFTRDAGSIRTVRGDTPVALLKEPDKLMVVETLRSRFGAAGAVTTFDADASSLHVELKGPGRQTDAEIDRATGKTTVTVERKGMLVRLDDLHRGKDAGKGWSLVIDASAALLLIGSLTGILMWLALPRRRSWGVAALVASVLICGVLYWLVP